MKIQIFKPLNFENSNFLNRHHIMKYLKNSSNFDLKNRYTLTTSLWGWYLNCQNGRQIWIFFCYLYRLFWSTSGPYFGANIWCFCGCDGYIIPKSPFNCDIFFVIQVNRNRPLNFLKILGVLSDFSLSKSFRNAFQCWGHS